MYRERERAWERWVEVKAMSHHQIWDALDARRRRLSGADWVLRGRKNKQVAFLIKESLKERVGELRSWGKRLRSKQAESFLYTHFLWFWALWEQEEGWNYVLVYAILHHLYSHSVCSLSHLHSRYMWLHENTWEQTGSYAWSLYVHTPSVFVALIEKKLSFYLKCQSVYNVHSSIAFTHVYLFSCLIPITHHLTPSEKHFLTTCICLKIFIS